MPTHPANADCPTLLLRRSEAAAQGFSKNQVDALLRSARWHTPVRGVLATTAGPLELAERCRAALLSRREPAVVSHLTASELHGLPVLQRLRTPVDLTLPPPATAEQPSGVRLHWPLLDPADVTVVQGVGCTTAARSILDVGRAVGQRDWAVVIADAALQRELVTVDELIGAVDRVAHPQHRRALLQMLDRVDGRSRSPKETQVRLILIDGGLPAPEPNWPLRGDDGRVIALGDLVYRRHLIWLEYDGFGSHGRREAFRYDRTRERLIRARGFDVIRLIDDDVVRPISLVRMVAKALHDAPERIAGLPASMSPEVAAARRHLGLSG